MDLALNSEAQLSVNERINAIAALEVADAIRAISLFAHTSAAGGRDGREGRGPRSIAFRDSGGGESVVTPGKEIRLVMVVVAAYLASDMLDELLSVTLASCRGLGADVDEIPGLVVAAGAEHVALGVVQERQELVEEAALALGGQLVLQAPQAAAQDGAPVVHVLARRHPVGSRVWAAVSRAFVLFCHCQGVRALLCLFLGEGGGGGFVGTAKGGWK